MESGAGSGERGEWSEEEGFGKTEAYGEGRKIISEKITGDIYGDERLKDKSFYWIENPEMIVDIANDKRTLYLIVDVHFDDEKYSKEDYFLINNLPWRLSIHGNGDIDEEVGIVKNYNLLKVNIEILPEMFYNEKNNDWDVVYWQHWI